MKKISKVIILILILGLSCLLVYRLFINKEPKVTENLEKENIKDTGPNNFNEEISFLKIDENQNQMINDADVNFALEFLKLNNKKENVIYSPLSIKYALNMLNEGADGKTKEEIENVITNTTLNKYNNQKNILSLANSLYIKNTYISNINDEYKNILKDKYQAEIKYDSFINANNINNWISKKTFNLIPEMLKDEQVANPNSILFLINALAIDMDWTTIFHDYIDSEFYINENSVMETKMMYETFDSDDVHYYLSENETVLFKDLQEYNNTQLEFIAIMPTNNLSDYIKNFTVDNLTHITNNQIGASVPTLGVVVNIPEFKYDYKLPLKENLESLGINDVFTPSANLSKIDSSNSLYVNEALHNATIDFKENGIKAAAATIFGMDYGATPSEEEPVILIFDKPFMYLIRDKKTKDIWFVGTMYKPKAIEESN